MWIILYRVCLGLSGGCPGLYTNYLYPTFTALSVLEFGHGRLQCEDVRLPSRSFATSSGYKSSTGLYREAL